MENTPSSPTIVIVPASFCPSSFYSAVSGALQDHGLETVVGTLQSTALEPSGKAATMQDDSTYFRQIISDLAHQEKEIVLVAHSYGGIVATECSQGLSRTERQASGQKGGIIQLVYMACIVPRAGHSLQDNMGDLLPDYINVEGEFMSLVPGGNAKITFCDLPYEEGLVWAKKMLYHSALSFGGPLTYPGYNYLPVAYIICQKDMAVPPDFQHQTVREIEYESGKKVSTFFLDAGHMPNISMPQNVAQVIRHAISQA
ncbi:hypothetical protein ASPWEDRAFT_45722 [Aspergillus wentii DTO 134E9]|uniref:AB hydrolase-1 domain-containing protein n=1 Tax=Aspergillus wentii DTO 134E9 TaxID=1073089 RepID=A0A1L9R5H2_ASPWE|nr:uncharacterized protein ASPWEDRAFT_45722 [Aspergillus wentii DTO 134E9]OJJ30159.1 hypothetical protein ASPWEDRAFT_45722 [Aspergillus wentii DTO 134E9]